MTALLSLMLVSSLLLISLTASAWAQQVDVRWDTLNLTPDQSSRIRQLDDQWQDTAGNVIPQIKKDKEELVRLLNSPNSDSRRILELQNRINGNKTRLQQAAMQTFLQKKQQLNNDQRMMLKMQMSPR